MNREVTSGTTLSDINDVITATYTSLEAPFDATWAFIATYYRVARFGGRNEVKPGFFSNTKQ